MAQAGIDIEKLRQGDRRQLAKAITLIESIRPDHQQQAQAILQVLLESDPPASQRIGISGAPGVGKSTFIEALGLHLIEQGKKVAVLAVDPSSPLSGGSILGDKTRMEELARQTNAFIRPTPAGDALGGVANKTREATLLCEAAGFDVVIIETVGVGQSEHQVASMVDFFMLLLLPSGGDELQGIKKGIIELVDLIVVNKADGETLTVAEQTRQQYLQALKLLHKPGHWQTDVSCCSSRSAESVALVWAKVQTYFQQLERSAIFQKRSLQNKAWFEHLVMLQLQQLLQQHPKVKTLWPQLEQSVKLGKRTAFSAAAELVGVIDSGVQ